MHFVEPKTLAGETRAFSMLLDGEIVPGSGSQAFSRKSPAHGQTVTTYNSASVEETERAIAAARCAFDKGKWSSMPTRERSALLLAIAQIIEDNREELALLDCLEAGKPLTQARGEIADSAELYRYAAGLARALHGESYANLRPDIFASTIRQPIGVVAMIAPWNFPFLIASQKIPFALAAGCTIVFKPSEMTSASMLRFGELVSGLLPRGVLNIVVGDGASVGEALARDPRVDMVSFTGSTRAGRQVSLAASETVKKVALELGGKNPQIICADADIEAAAAAVVHGVFFNAGQCCQAAGRIIVEQSIAREFTDRVLALSKEVVVGDTLDARVQMGAIVSDAQMKRITSLVASTGAEGGNIELGGHRISGAAGHFFEPTVVTGVASAATLSQEEVFGPVLSISTFSTFDEAVSIANTTRYGLGAGLWTGDSDRILEGLKGIRAGTVWINCFMEVFPEMPFGGFKESGLGRECGKLAVEDYTETKSVVLGKVRKKVWS